MNINWERIVYDECFKRRSEGLMVGVFFIMIYWIYRGFFVRFIMGSRYEKVNVFYICEI